MVVHTLEFAPKDSVSAHASGSAHASLSDRWEYRAYMALLVPVSLIVVAFRHLRGERLARDGAGRLVAPWTEARELAQRTAPWVFMGR